jgi:hypothetical protein
MHFDARLHVSTMYIGNHFRFMLDRMPNTVVRHDESAGYMTALLEN